MELLAMYDICDKKRLRRIEKAMKGYGVRVQKSIFECSIKESVISKMKKEITKLMNLDEDAFRIYPLLNNSRIKQTIIGKGEMLPFAKTIII